MYFAKQTNADHLFLLIKSFKARNDLGRSTYLINTTVNLILHVKQHLEYLTLVSVPCTH